MFTLIGLGISIAYGYSVIAVIFPNLFPAAFHLHGQINLYFETASVITALVLMGQIFELKGREQTGGALHALLDLSPKTARRIKGQIETEIPLNEIQINDELRVRPGEKIPTDGVIIPSESLCSRKILAVVSPKFVHITRLILGPDSSGVRHALAHSGLRAVATTMT